MYCFNIASLTCQLFVYYLIWNSHSAGVHAVPPNDFDYQQPLSEKQKTLRAGQVTVHVISDFLPHDLAVKWRDAMSAEWDARFLCDDTDSMTCTDSAANGWRYTTNNNGIFHEFSNNNAKVRSLDNIADRNATAQRMKEANLFSYAKWELDPNHPLVKEMERTFLSDEIVDKVSRSLTHANEKIEISRQELSVLFVTHYSTGDFLSEHDDSFSGTFAFVVSLMDGPEPNREWRNDFGGLLCFECEDGIRQGWCEVLKPAFNTAVLFRTRTADGGMGPFHEVLPVSWQAEVEGLRRFGLTGWYMDIMDDMPDHVKLERDKMRAK